MWDYIIPYTIPAQVRDDDQMLIGYHYCEGWELERGTEDDWPTMYAGWFWGPVLGRERAYASLDALHGANADVSFNEAALLPFGAFKEVG